MAISLLATSVGAVAAVEENSQAFVLCKSSKDVRTIRVSTGGSDGSCQTVYTKLGQDQVVSGGRALSSCKFVLASIRTNLEAASWNCRSVEGAKTISGEELLRR